MRVISLASSPRLPSRSAALLQLSQRWLQQQQVEVIPYTLHDFQAEDLLRRPNEALDSFYLALSRRKPPVLNTAASLLTRQTA